MANTPGAKKAIRKIERRTEVNKARRSRVRTFLRKFEEALSAGDVAAAKGIRSDQLERFRPWLAEATLSVAALQSQGAWAHDGVEQVLSAGLDVKVERRAFETPEQQINILANVSEAEQMSSLEETLRRMDEEPDTS